jgi:phage host-nuclease inhibitor protein Gam
MESVSAEQVIPSIEGWLEDLAGIEAALKANQAAAEAERKKILETYGPATDALTAQAEELVGLIEAAFTEHRALLTKGGGKTVVFRGGELSAAFTPESLVIENEAKAEKWLRRKRKWLKYTKPAKRKIDKNALKKDKDFVKSAPDSVMRFSRDEILHIKLPKLQLEITRVMKPLAVRLAKKSD